MPTANETKPWNEQQLIELARKKIADRLADTLVTSSLHLRGPDYATQAHGDIARHREAFAAVVTAIEASR